MVISGMSGAISKMLVVPANDLYDVDAYIEGEFGSDIDDENDEYRSIFARNTDSMTDLDQGKSRACGHTDNNKEFEATISLDPETDPFAPRAGKTLSWRGVNMTLVSFAFVLF